MPVVRASWMVFTAPGDSIEVNAEADEGHPQASITIWAGAGAHQERDSRGNTAPFGHIRSVSGGILNVSVDLSGTGEDSVAYTLRLRRDASIDEPRFRLTGRWATIALSSSRKETRIRIVPLSGARVRRDDQSWTLAPGTYKVALVTDTLYQVCALPCLSPDTVLLVPTSKVTRRY